MKLSREMRNALDAARSLSGKSYGVIADQTSLSESTVRRIFLGDEDEGHWEGSIADCARAVGIPPDLVLTSKLDAVVNCLPEVPAATDARSQRLRHTILERDGHSCRYCGAPAELARGLHLIRQFPADPPTEENLMTACRECYTAFGGEDVRQAPPLEAELDGYQYVPWRKFAEGIRWLRTKPGLTVEEFADFCETEPDVIKRAEDPLAMLNHVELRQLTAYAFEATIEAVCERDTDAMKGFAAYRTYCNRIAEEHAKAERAAQDEIDETLAAEVAGLPESEIDLMKKVAVQREEEEEEEEEPTPAPEPPEPSAN
jgi:transcriptional regulator with XRE-family HTH domain